PHCHGPLQLYIPRIVPPINGGSMDEYRGSMDGYVYKDSMGGFAKFLIFCVLIVAIGALIGFWPGQYQYYTAQGGILVRVNRISCPCCNAALQQGFCGLILLKSSSVLRFSYWACTQASFHIPWLI